MLKDGRIGDGRPEGIRGDASRFTSRGVGEEVLRRAESR